MTTDILMLILSAILCVAQTLPYAMGIAAEHGNALLMGNRENMPPITGWPGRAMRAHGNMLENLLPFTALVLAAHLTGHVGYLTQLGAIVFFVARAAYVVIYIAGIPGLRTLAWLVCVVGMGLIAVNTLFL